MACTTVREAGKAERAKLGAGFMATAPITQGLVGELQVRAGLKVPLLFGQFADPSYFEPATEARSLLHPVGIPVREVVTLAEAANSNTNSLAPAKERLLVVRVEVFVVPPFVAEVSTGVMGLAPATS